MENLVLVRPSDEYAGEVMDFQAEMLQNGDSFDGCAGLEDVKSYAEWADFEPRLKARYGDGYVPSEAYLAVRPSDRRLIGILDFRLRLFPLSAAIRRQYRLQRPPLRTAERVRDRDAAAGAPHLPGAG